jgi:hypothetical protein
MFNVRFFFCFDDSDNWQLIFKGIHTSINKGTMKRNCHQDWLMGRCGRMQEAAGRPPHGSLIFNLIINAF